VVYLTFRQTEISCETDLCHANRNSIKHGPPVSSKSR
jgi:hypothetical protein